MTTKLFSCSIIGLKVQIFEVEADISQGLPSFSIVGLGGASIQEAKERVRASIKNSGVTYPPNKKIINLAPAEIKKQGSFFDLPIALGILAASNQISTHKLNDALIVGELSLNGAVRRIHGALAIAQHAKEKGFKKIFLPEENANEASFIDGLEIYTPRSLRDMIDFCHGKIELPLYPHTDINRYHGRLRIPAHYSITKIIGLNKVKRGLSIAAAGGHNVLLSGPPGTGKTILARAFSELVPQMSKEEIMECSKIFSIVGLTQEDLPLILKRPIREVHHTASLTSIIGGGATPHPGEITLAHNGILFFDEITEFPHKILEALRQPLEDKFINIGRGHYSCRFPSNFIFIATMNPCPCGYANDPKIPCICTPAQKSQYQKRLSGPIRDRFDIFLDVPNISMANIFQDHQNEEELLITRINKASLIQKKRFKFSSSSKRNSDLGVEEIKSYCMLDEEGKKLIDRAKQNLQLSNRGYIRTIRIARTIADMDESENIQIHHLAEALQYK